jgi:membrane protein DedA with SNARE-associated domain
MLETFGAAMVDFVRANQAWAVPFVFTFALAESLAFLSLLVPGSFVLIGISTILGASGVSFWPVWIAAGVGGTIGYAISYWLGYYYKDQIREMWPLRDQKEMMQRGEVFFAKWGILGVFFGHFFGPVRAVIPVIAGMVSMPQMHFQLANVSSSFLWAAGVLGPGMLGSSWWFGKLGH